MKIWGSRRTFLLEERRGTVRRKKRKGRKSRKCQSRVEELCAVSMLAKLAPTLYRSLFLRYIRLRILPLPLQGPPSFEILNREIRSRSALLSFDRRRSVVLASRVREPCRIVRTANRRNEESLPRYFVFLLLPNLEGTRSYPMRSTSRVR